MSQAASLPPLTTRFTLGEEITPEQRAFLEAHGFLLFGGVARPSEVDAIVAEPDRIEAAWIAEGRRCVNGIPIFYHDHKRERSVSRRQRACKPGLCRIGSAWSGGGPA